MDIVRPLLRNLIEDNAKACKPDIYTYTGIATFSLTEPNIDSSTIVVYKNQVLYASSNYSYNSNTGKLTITGLATGNVIEIYYSAYNVKERKNRFIESIL